MRVLQISPFAIPEEPASGGLIRIAETAKAYADAGCEVQRSCIVTRERDRHHRLDMQLPWWDKIRRRHWGPPSNLGPLRIRWSTLRSSQLAERLSRAVDAPIDVIHLEHPWAIRLAHDLRQQPAFHHSRLVYGSHNHEASLCESIWRRQGAWNPAARRLVRDIEAAERECAQQADLCWAVSAADVSTLHDMGARQVVLAPNACRPLPARSAQTDAHAQPYALFVGGDYSPNIQGFLRWIGPHLADLPRGCRVVMAGGAGDRLAALPDLRPFLERGTLHNLGRVEQKALDQWLLHAHTIVLPIDDGGGSNLKTAEALLSQRPVVATPTSLRGFEAWESSSQVFKAEVPSAFMAQVRSLLSAPFCADALRQNTDSLTWRESLSTAVKRSLEPSP